MVTPMNIVTLDGAGYGEAFYPCVSKDATGSGPSSVYGCGAGHGGALSALHAYGGGCGRGTWFGLPKFYQSGSGLGCGAEWHYFRNGKRPYDLA